MESLFFPLLLALLAGFMFLSIRKQKKRVSEMQDMQNSVATGARVQLTSGMFATVVEAGSGDFVDLEIATGVVTRFNRAAVVRVVPTEDAAETYPGALTERPEEIVDDPSPTLGADPITDDSVSTERPGDTPSDEK
ncbi:preprotein translocase subunit YajC [Gordonia hankookensis]|uniref:Preprotein translocase subunit YajC n=1 Tax=Gordonia hankookensis TaxID=589403 RepID=A0ABR7WGH0_9ACTN|nr:preprotein translocase subunit YajC [Gordonia hankookensis]MBD1321876.1 preprotein translocase subunit YajC [Gordonia hankookensis]NDZ95213.1 preprotein translocase subunit YajC [Streptomyces sp. SID11726]NEB24317.1 preprotein translocase subunit YajC [Streptomyces sp. SID6673]